MFLVRDWWPAGNAYVSWIVNDMKSAYSEYSGTTPSSTSEFAGILTLIRRVSTGTLTGASAGSPTIPQSSMWEVQEDHPNDLIIEYGIEGHTGAWSFDIDPDNSNIILENDQDEPISGIMDLAMIEVFPSTRTMPDPFWELYYDDLYLTGATQ